MSLDPETVASIDSVEAVAYARAMGESVAMFYQAMVEGGLPPHLAEQAVICYIESRFAAAAVFEDEEGEDE